MPYGLFYDSYELSSKAFCLAWFLATSWYLAINVMRTKIRNHFRIQTSLDQCHHVEIQRPRKVIKMLSDENESRGIQQRLASLEFLLREILGFDTLTKTVSVQRDSQGNKYFEFQSTRYTFNTHLNQFTPAVVQISLNPEDLLGMAVGLDSETAKQRLELIGPNFIKVQVPSFLEACWQE